MLSYRHSFHAGNHADVLKHVVLTLIIESLKEKEKGFSYIDTHAGAGLYQLTAKYAQKKAEYLQGIARLWGRTDSPKELATYYRVIEQFNSDKNLVFYPGSPLVASELLREVDKLFLTELHPSDLPLLQESLRHNKRVTIEKKNGYQQLKAKLPPVSRRGLVLMDPSYELKSDYQSVISALQEGYKRFATGIYVIWYPVVLRQHISKMIKTLKASSIRSILQIELAVAPDNSDYGMTGSGLFVVNTPWKLEAEMKTVLPWLQKVLVPEAGGHTLCQWVTPE